MNSETLVIKKYWNHVFSRQLDIGCVEARNASCTVCKWCVSFLNTSYLFL